MPRDPIGERKHQGIAVVIDMGIFGTASKSFQNSRSTVRNDELEVVETGSEDQETCSRCAGVVVDIAVKLSNCGCELLRYPSRKPAIDAACRAAMQKPIRSF
jgi:hypothetical protein